jgi:lipooligosaccharide transport system permease protein
VRTGDILAGQLGFIALRVALAAGAFLVVMVPFGAVGSAWAVVTPVVAVLTGLAVAAPMFAYAATVDSDNLLAIMFRFALLPMMLFSGVFFPVAQLPAALEPLAYALPLWHGVELCRAAAVGVGTAWPVPVHVGFLAVWIAGGFLLAVVRFRKRLAG